MCRHVGRFVLESIPRADFNQRHLARPGCSSFERRSHLWVNCAAFRGLTCSAWCALDACSLETKPVAKASNHSSGGLFQRCSSHRPVKRCACACCAAVEPETSTENRKQAAQLPLHPSPSRLLDTLVLPNDLRVRGAPRSQEAHLSAAHHCCACWEGAEYLLPVSRYR